jgi:heterotetrameric sarcosine oxidase gamma subunit
MTHNMLAGRAAFAQIAHASDSRAGVIASDRDGLGIATVLVRKNQATALALRVRERFAIELPRGLRRSAADDVAFAGTAPGTWLATGEGGGSAFARALKAILTDTASVSDQSSGYAALRLTGPKLRDTLAKMLPIDLHERAFAPGEVAVTMAMHVGVTLWRLQDAGDGMPVFEITMFRSLAASLWHGLAASAAEFGLIMMPALTGPTDNSAARDAAVTGVNRSA